MEQFELLSEIGHLCKTHDVLFKISTRGFYIKKYFYYDGIPHGFIQYYIFDVLKNIDIEGCILDFEKRFEKEIARRKSNES